MLFALPPHIAGVASPLRLETLSPSYLSCRPRARIRSVALLVVVVVVASSSSSSSSSQSDFFLSFFEDAFYSKTLQNANAAHRSASRDDAKNASSVFSRRMSLKTLARRGKRTETRNTETTTIVGEEHRFCLVVDGRGGPKGAEELCASTPDESISRLVQ